jgi:anti-sigma regulatory factor (Ser/Thr protein kinase)
VVDPADGARFLHSTALGPPIGAIPGAEYRTGETHLDPGGRLLLYTDGLVEDRRSSLDTGLRTLLETADAPAEHVEDLLDHLLAGAVDRPRRDDIALLGLQTTDARRFTLTLPADPTRLTVLRRRMESFLTAHRVPDDDIFDLTVAVSEAAANAIEHPVEPTAATISVEVRVEDGAVEGGVVAGGVVVARVRNSGRWQSSPSDRHRGRGLALIRSLAELDVSSDDAGTAVTMRRRFDRKP